MRRTVALTFTCLTLLPLMGSAASLPDCLPEWSRTLLESKVDGAKQPFGATAKHDLESAAMKLLARYVGQTAATTVIDNVAYHGNAGNAACVLSYAGTQAGVSNEFAAHMRPDDQRPLYLATTGLESQTGVDFNAAKKFLLEGVLNNETAGLKLVGWPELVKSAQVKLRAWGKTVNPPGDRFWVFFVDDQPMANWQHACRYIFVAPDLSAYAIMYARDPLEIIKTTANAASPWLPEVIVPFHPVLRKTAQAPKLNAIEPEAGNGLIYTGNVSNCYAVIISGGYNMYNNHSRYWSDAAFFYSTLTKKYGYLHDHIFALISDGTDPADDRNDDYIGGGYTNSPTDLDGDSIVDTYASAILANVSNVFSQLAGILATNDQLVVFTTDHGSQASGRHVYLNLWNEEELHDYDMKAMTTNLPCPVMFIMEQCFSGGFADDLNQTSRLIATACDYDKSSYAGYTFDQSHQYYYYDQYVYYWTAAVRGCFPGSGTEPWVDGVASTGADVNYDGYVSFKEASDYAYINRFEYDTPQYNESPTNFGNIMFVTQLGTNLHPTQAWIGLNPPTLDFCGTYGAMSPMSGAFTITSVSQIGFSYSNAITYSEQASGWLDVQPTTGTIAGNGTQSVVVTVNAGGFNAGIYTATNQVASTNALNSPQNVIVTLTVNRANQTISFANPGDQIVTNTIGLSATSSEGFAVSFIVWCGLAQITDGTNLSFRGAGPVSILARQAGNTNWNAANITNTFNVSKARQTLAFPAIPDQSATARVALAATADSGLAASFSVVSGPGSISNNNILTFSGAGVVTVVASQDGNATWDAAPNVTNNVAVNDVSTLSVPENVQASDGTCTTNVALTWNAVSGASGYQVWRARENNVGAAANMGNAILSSYDDNSSAVRSATMFYYWVKAWNSVATSEFSNVDSGFCRMSADPEIISGQPAVGDYDGDGKADPAVYDLSSGRLFVWLSSAEYVLVTPVTTFQVAVGDSPMAGDFDGDALADPAVFNRATGSWYIWLSGAGYIRAGPVMCGVSANDIPVPADYDGDRKTDPTVYQASSGGWYIWLSSAAYVRVGPFQFQQSAADIPVPGQFDAGHAADPAVYQQSAGSWYIWLSSAGYYRIGPATFATTDDHLPVPADYDGDGLCDPAAYVPSSGKWRMWLSGSNYGLIEIYLK